MTKITQAEIDRANNEIIDPELGLSRQQLKDSLKPSQVRNANNDRDDRNNRARNLNARHNYEGSKNDNSYGYDSSEYTEPAIPEASNILTTPIPSSVMNDKLISISVTDDIPLKDVLIELSRLADVDMEIDPRIDGGIILRVKDKPFNTVIDKVSALGGLRYSVKDGIMRVERDTPYKMDYEVDFLNMTRTSESSISVDTQGLGGSESELPSGSASSTTQSSEADVWTSVEEAVTNILNFTQQTNILSTARFEDTTAAASDGSASLQLNRQAGVISVIATNKQHESIKDYLEKVRKQVSTQVLIEAKVVEVTLDEQYRSGVDWSYLSNEGSLSITGNFDAAISNTADFFTISASHSGASSLTKAISFTEQFGVTRTLSSPRLNAMNNQQAVLSFAENLVYFTIEAQEEEEDDGAGGTSTTLTIDSESNTIPVGVILTLQPSINLDTNEITMHVRPTLSRITDTVSDPGVAIIAARNNVPSIQSNIPIVEIRELDSVLKIKSGEIMVIGGLMQDIQSSEDKGVPFMNRAPIVGNLFKSKVQTTSTVETVIFIKATIIKNNDTRSIHKDDKNYYNTFVPKDSRPLAF
ncbi:MAG: hypothetical protein PQ612_02015 [Rickettsiales bacterium]|nr:hypothetical protein [Pseudomonadota bacterium]MDA0967098.1 hypothetical protein [Pseudomonadota bacterium]MDG4542416.1 hypothetical protein [Rickettsiales bacterium]MDG4544920.1 hypothetical protein [Rickettsiales bacterium]MDG4547043.1 hypothetical protein [Rickettsiales bacterium]